MKYWYENTALRELEEEGYALFAKEYKGLRSVEFAYDEEKHFVVTVEIGIQVTKAALLAQAESLPENLRKKAVQIINAVDEEQPRRIFDFYIQYEHDFPGRNSDGKFGGPVKVFSMNELKPGLSHMLFDAKQGQYYICQAASLRSSQINSKAVMERIKGFMANYIFWELTGYDLDIMGDGAWRK